MDVAAGEEMSPIGDPSDKKCKEELPSSSSIEGEGDKRKSSTSEFNKDEPAPVHVWDDMVWDVWEDSFLSTMPGEVEEAPSESSETASNAISFDLPITLAEVVDDDATLMGIGFIPVGDDVDYHESEQFQDDGLLFESPWRCHHSQYHPTSGSHVVEIVEIKDDEEFLDETSKSVNKDTSECDSSSTGSTCISVEAQVSYTRSIGRFSVTNIPDPSAIMVESDQESAESSSEIRNSKLLYTIDGQILDRTDDDNGFPYNSDDNKSTKTFRIAADKAGKMCPVDEDYFGIHDVIEEIPGRGFFQKFFGRRKKYTRLTKKPKRDGFGFFRRNFRPIWDLFKRSK